jgi:hypothetical protein
MMWFLLKWFGSSAFLGVILGLLYGFYHLTTWIADWIEATSPPPQVFTIPAALLVIGFLIAVASSLSE